MKPPRLSVLLLVLCAFSAGLIAADALSVSNQLPGMSGPDRRSLCDYLAEFSTSVGLWREYCTFTEGDRAYFAGVQQGLEIALHAHRTWPSTPTPQEPK